VRFVKVHEIMHSGEAWELESGSLQILTGKDPEIAILLHNLATAAETEVRIAAIVCVKVPLWSRAQLRPGAAEPQRNCST